MNSNISLSGLSRCVSIYLALISRISAFTKLFSARKVQKITSNLLKLLLTLVFWAGTCQADTNLVIYPGPGGFNLRGEYLDNVATMDITVDYDAAALAQPRVSRGAGLGQSQFDVESGSSGRVGIRIKTPKPLRGIVMLANLAFTRQGDDPGSISNLSAVLSDKNGSDIPVKVSIINPALKPDDPASRKSEARSAASSPSRPIIQPHPITMTTPEVEQHQSVTPVAAPVSNSSSFVRLESVQDHFRRYSGPRTPQALRNLFKLPDASISQQPEVVLSDGSSTIRIIVRLTGEKGKAPIFLLRRAHHIALSASEREWVMEVLPERGTYDATLTVMNGAELREYPLTVAPPQDLVANSSSLPVWLQDYITTANKLAAGITRGSESAPFLSLPDLKTEPD